MPPAARVADPTTHGAPLAPGPGSTDVLIGGMPAWRALMDQHACPLASITGPDGVGMVMMGSPTVMIDYMMACRMGDIVVEVPGLAMGPMNPIIMGCPTVMIGEVGMGTPESPMAAAAGQAAQVVAAGAQGGAAVSVFAQEGVMKSAAAAGTPFCEVCEKMRLAQQQRS
ncbi:MAG: PAAR domain-containing protein [Terracidiphilus sp.]